MNHFIITLITLALGICGTVRALGGSTNLLEICAGLNALPHGFINSKINITDFLPPLEQDGRRPSVPAVWMPRRVVLSDEDFLSYNQTNHTFTVTAEVAKRFVNALRDPDGTKIHRKPVSWMDIPGIPFEMSVSGEPIYVGLFFSPLSSERYSCPIIEARFDLSEDPTNIVLFTIMAGAGEAFDVRSDPRILAALVKLGLAK